MVAPTDHLRQPPNPMDFGWGNAAQNDYLVALGGLTGHDYGGCFRRGHSLRLLSVVADSNKFRIRDAKINTCERPLVAATQLSKPLVRDIKIASDRHCKDARRIWRGAPSETDAAALNRLDSGFRRKVDEHCHIGNMPTINNRFAKDEILGLAVKDAIFRPLCSPTILQAHSPPHL